MRWFLVSWLFILSAVSYLDRVNISVAGRSIAEDYGLSNVQLGYVFSAMLIGYALFQTVGGRLADRFGPRRVLDRGRCVVGNLHRTDRPGAVHNPWGAVPVYCYSLSSGCRGGSGLSLVEPICGAMDSGARTRHCQRLDFCRRRRGRRPFTAVDYLLHAALRLEIVFLGMCHHRLDRGRGLVSHGARCARGTSVCVRQSELETIRSGLPIETEEHGRQRPASLAELSFGAGKCERSQLSYFCFGYTAWIFFSWFFIYLAQVRGLNLKSSAFYAMLPPVAMSVCSFAGRRHQRRAHEMARPALGALRTGGIRHCPGRNILAFGSQVESARVASVVLAGGAGALYLVAEFVLVGECRHCRQGVRFGFRLHEHGGADWRSSHGVTHARNCRPLWLDRVVPCGRRAVSAGGGGVADG